MTGGLRALWSKHGSTVLFIASQICMVAGPILSAKATPKAVAAVEQYKKDHFQDFANKHDEDEYDQYVEPTKLELIKAGCYNAYGPAIGVTILGIATGGMCFSRQQKQIQAWSTAYNVASTSQRYFEEALKENVSKEKFDKIKSEVAAKECASIEPTTMKQLEEGTGLSYFKDDWSKQIFRCDTETIRRIQNDINESLNNEGRVPLNECYVMMQNAGCDVEPVEIGWGLGWEATVPYENVKIDIDITQLKDGTPCGLISFNPKPRRF